jgi:lipoprotein-anchoring transpeptidase ErfK/SrfK
MLMVLVFMGRQYFGATGRRGGHDAVAAYPASRLLGMNSRARWGALMLVALFAVVAGCGGGGSATLGTQVVPTSTTTAVPQATKPVGPPVAYDAQAKVANLAIYSSPTTAQPQQTVPNPWVVDPNYPDQTVPQVFLVKEQRSDGWVQVLLPVRPNGSTGWVHASDVTITPNPYHVVVSLGAHQITVTGGSGLVYQGAVAVGAPSTPTPTGQYYIRVLEKAIDPTTVYGPYAYGLSSHSDALTTFDGGDAEIGIHGNNDASVLGTNVTHGCVRMDNDAITMLSKLLPLGTPVDINA